MQCYPKCYNTIVESFMIMPALLKLEPELMRQNKVSYWRRSRCQDFVAPRCEQFQDRLATETKLLTTHTFTMSVRQTPRHQQSAPERPVDDDSDVEEEALANDYREQVGYEDGDGYDLDRSNSMGGGPQDLQAQLVAAAQPLEYQASIETKIQSYDSYCNLFHFILNSEGPVDIELPSVSGDTRRECDMSQILI